MLRAPISSLDRAANQRTPIAVSSATLRDVPRLAVAHTAAVAARRPRAVRLLIWPALIATALQMVGQVGRGEVLITGHGSSVVLTPTAGRRRTPIRAIATAALAYVLFVLVTPLAVAMTAALLGGLAAIVGVLGAAVYLLAIGGSPLLAVRGRGRRAGAHPAEVALPAADGPVVRLHDLVRDPRDPAGTGVALLHAVIREPRFDAATIITTAATGPLADAYRAAGMTSIRGTTDLFRRPQTQSVGVAA